MTEATAARSSVATVHDRDRARKLAIEARRRFREARVPAGEFRSQFEVIYAEQLVHQNEDCYEAAQKLRKAQEHFSYPWLQVQLLLESAVVGVLILGAECRERGPCTFEFVPR